MKLLSRVVRIYYFLFLYFPSLITRSSLHTLSLLLGVLLPRSHVHQLPLPPENLSSSSFRQQHSPERPRPLFRPSQSLSPLSSPKHLHTLPQEHCPQETLFSILVCGSIYFHECESSSRMVSNAFLYSWYLAQCQHIVDAPTWC